MNEIETLDYRDIIHAVNQRLHGDGYDSIEAAEEDIQLLLLHADDLRDKLESKAVKTRHVTGPRTNPGMAWKCDLCGAMSEIRSFDNLNEVWVTHHEVFLLWTHPDAEEG